MARKVGEQQRFEIRLFLQRTRERGGEIVDHDVEMPQGPVTTVVPAIASGTHRTGGPLSGSEAARRGPEAPRH